MDDHKVSRIHRFFSDLVHSRSRSESPKSQEQKQVDIKASQRANQAAFQQNKHLLPSAISTEQIASSQASKPLPVEDHKRIEPKYPDTQDPLAAKSEISTLDSKPDTVKLPDHANIVAHSPDTKVSGTAYDDAWSQLSEDERTNLSKEASIKTLFEKLDETDQQHQSNSWLKRGKMSAGLQYVSNICGYINLVTTWIPVPSLDAALGLLKGIVAIAVGICGAYDGLTSHIREFLDHIPVIERCNTVTWSNNASFDIHNILVTCYLILLSFYSKVMAFLQEDSRIRQILETFHSEIPGIVTSFNGHADKLSKMMEVETLVTVTKIWNQEVDNFVKANLYKLSQHHIGSRNAEERNRSDEACQWIISEETFEDWAYGAHGVLTMYGVVGCGKTATASYVAKYLSEEAKAPVLVYHCMQQEEDELQLILCSLTYQLLQKKAELKAKFQEWSDKRQATCQDKPSNEPAVLAEFLCGALQDSREQVFIILDGLDECEQDARRELLVLFRDLICNGALVKVFVSSRQRDDIIQTLSGSETTEEEPATEPVSQIPLFHINMNPGEERDRILATHLAANHTGRGLDSKGREKAIEQLAKRAGGSAIWLKIAMTSLADAKNERGIKDCLEFLETSPTLVDWYQRLFKSAESGPYIYILERALETLAVARRPLSIDELSRAAFIDDTDNGESLDLLNEAAASVDFLSLVRPFVSTLEESADGKSLRVRLVHQSLLDLLLKARPSEWYEMAATRRPRRITKKEKEQRSRELNEQLMGRCVKYLLLDNLKDKSSDEEADNAPDTDIEDHQEDDEPGVGFGFDDMFVEPEVQKRARAQALVFDLHFYDYAASHWASHFAACEEDAPDELKENARTLLGVTVSECTDWVSFVRAEKEAAGEVFPSSSEPATLAAYFGLTATLTDILADPGTVPQPTKDQALFWASRGGRDHIVKLLLKNDADANQRLLDGHTALTVAAHRGHLECAQALLADRRTDINLRGSRGRTALSFAAGSGHEKICAALLKRGDCRPDEADFVGMTPFFYAIGAEHLSLIRMLAAHPGVDVNHREKAGRTALFCSAGFGTIKSLKQLLDTEGVDVNLPDKEGKSPLIWAAFRGQAACVDALMQHAKIDKTAVHFKDRKNAIHYACAAGMHEVLLCLLKHHCPGIDDPDVDGWTPLMWAIEHGPDCIRTLLATGRVEVERRDKEGKTVLFLAVQWNSTVEVVKVLLRHGADPETTDNNGQTPLDVAMKGGRPEDFIMANEVSSWITKKRSERIPHVQST